MAIRDVDDLLRQLREHPEWRDALRRELASEDMLALPGIVRELAEAQRRTDERLAALTTRVEELAEAQRRTDERLAALTTRVEELAEAQRRTDERLAALTTRVEELAEAQKRTEQRLEELAEAQKRTEQNLAALTARVDDLAAKLAVLTERVDVLTGHVDELRGSDLERRYREHPGAFFAPVLRKVRALRDEQLDELADDAINAGKLDLKERADLLRSDVVVSGRDTKTRAETYVLMEVSGKVDLEDVQRASRRAEILAKAVEKPVIAAVGGHAVTERAQQLAERLGVTVLLDGAPQPEE